MQRFPRFPVKQTKRGRVSFNQWLGVNTTDANTALQPGYVPYGKNVDFSREPGAAAKRLGTEALFASLGAGTSLGAHTYKHSSGNRVLVGWDDDVYKLAGETSTLTKTSVADFDAGTLTDTDAIIVNGSDELQLAIDAASSEVKFEDQEMGSGSAGVTVANNNAMTFLCDQQNISSIEIYNQNDWGGGENITLELYKWDTNYATTIAGALLGSVTVNGPQSDTSWIKFSFSSPIFTVDGDTYLYLLTVNAGTVNLGIKNPGVYAFGTAYINGVDQGYDRTFRINSKRYESSGTWLSPVYDLTNTPVNATLSWTATTPANTSITVYASGSQDNVNFGGWQVVSVSGDGIPLARYIKVRAVFATTDTTVTPVLSDFTITTETAFTTTESIKSGVSNNKVRFVDWNGNCYFAYGGIPQVYDNETVRNITTALSVEDCEDAWAEQVVANVTTETDGSDKKVGNASVKLTVAAGAGTGILASEAIASTNLSTYDSIRIWVKSSVELASGDIQLLLDNTALCASPLETLDIPAVVADTWTLCTLTLANPASDTAIISVGVNMAVDKGAFILRLDDVNAIHDTTYPVELSQVSIIYNWKNYMLYVDNSEPTRLYISDVGAPGTLSAGATGYKEMPNTILGISGYNDALIVTGVNFTKAIHGTIFDGSADDDTVIKDLGNEYAVSHEAMVECVDYTNRNILVFGTKAGPKYLVPGLQEQSLQTLPLARNVQKYFQNSIERQNQAMAFNKQKLYVAITYNEPGEAAVYTNNAVMCYDFQAGQWSGPWTLNVAGFTVAQGTDANGFTQSDELFMVDSTKGRLYQMDKGTSDAGSNIVYTLDTPYLGEAWNKREYQWLRLTVSDASVTTTLALTVKIDNNSDSIAPGATSTWNVGSWGGDDQGKQDAIVSPNQYIHAPPGRYFGIRVTDDSTNDFIIYGLEAEYIEYVGVV